MVLILVLWYVLQMKNGRKSGANLEIHEKAFSINKYQIDT